MDFRLCKDSTGEICFDTVQNNIMKLTLFLYSELNLNRDAVDKIIQTFNSFIADLFIPLVKSRLRAELKERSIDPLLINFVNLICEENKDIFRKFLSEHNRFQIFKNDSVYVEPEKFKLSDCQDESDDPIANEKNSAITAVHMPLHRSLQIFLSLPGLFEEVQAYLNRLEQETEVISNVIQTKWWKEKYGSSDRIVLPVLPFTDDFQPGNALGSHASTQKLCAVYTALPFLPPHLASKSKNILVNTIFYAKHRVEFGNRAVYQKIVDDLKLLSEDGIEITVSGKVLKLFFEAPSLSGDNLGLNAALGFTESFHRSSCCRDCIASPELMKTLCVEVPNLLRTKGGYEIDVRNMQNGIKEDCLFHQVPKYHVTDNTYFDFMHNVVEGTAKDVLEKILTVIVCRDHIIDLNTLNSLVKGFNYGDLESSNKPQSILSEKCDLKDAEILKTKKKIRLKQSASELLCLSRYLSLIIGDLIPKYYKPWKLYLTLRKIIDIGTAPRFKQQDIDKVRHLVKRHNELYLEMFGYLKPKGHFGTHMARSMEKNGPLVHCWGMKFERKHASLKQVATNTNSSINLPYTIGVNCQLKFCYLNETWSSCRVEVEMGRVEIADASSEILRLFPNLENPINATRYKSVNIDGSKLTYGTVIVNGLDDEFGEPAFAKIMRIYKVDGRLIFHMSSLGRSIFNAYLHAYEVIDNEIPDKILEYDEKCEIIPCVYVKKEEKYYVALRHSV